MATVIAEFPDGSILDYDQGKFDTWCLYLTRPGVSRHAPSDIQYFNQLKQYADKYSAEQVYEDFVRIYDATELTRNIEVHKLIREISQKYNGDSLEVEILFNILYAAMLSEQNRAGTRLGKRIKRLGVHQLLIEDCTVDRAAGFSRNQSWRFIAAECQQRGF
jgi:hypothetical protein